MTSQQRQSLLEAVFIELFPNVSLIHFYGCTVNVVKLSDRHQFLKKVLLTQPFRYNGNYQEIKCHNNKYESTKDKRKIW